MLALQQTAQYKRHRPENTLLYQLVERYYPQFTTTLAEQNRYLPNYVEREFDDFLRCGRLEHGFLRVACGHCKHEKLVAFSCKRRGFCPSCGAIRMAISAALLVDDVLKGYPIRQWVLSLPIPLRLLLARYPSELGKVLGIIHRAISTHIVNRAGFSNKQAKTGAVTLIQRFGSALNLNIHFHMLFLEGAISENAWGGTTFTRIKAPSYDDMVELVHIISHRIAKYLEKVGIVQRDMENSYLNLPIDDEDSLLQLQGASVSYRIAMGPQRGQKVFTLQTLPASTEGEYGQLANTSGFSLHAGVFANADEPEKLERLCRYISRPAISEQRLSMTQHGKVRYELKTPYRDGTTHVFFDPVDFIGKLAALIPPPRLNLTRFGLPASSAYLRQTATCEHKLLRHNVERIALNLPIKKITSQLSLTMLGECHG
ncbi:transposase [Alteromonas sp.]|uniref:transposase n=1 Tax=Alteromonas sp. TaxID=232 RepID=UPI003F4C9C19